MATVLEEVKSRMKEMKDNKAAQLEKIQQKQAEARTQIEAAALAMKQATENIDVDSYEEAKSKKRKAQTALEMYNGRYEQIRAKELISEADSDKVIDSLLEYENQLAADFKAAAAVHLKKLAELLKDYRATVQDIEHTLAIWQHDIHANYSTRGATTYYNEFTGTHTDRSPQPIPVHRSVYIGCAEAGRLEEYLKKEALLINGN